MNFLFVDILQIFPGLPNCLPCKVFWIRLKIYMKKFELNSVMEEGILFRKPPYLMGLRGMPSEKRNDFLFHNRFNQGIRRVSNVQQIPTYKLKV